MTLQTRVREHPSVVGWMVIFAALALWGWWRLSDAQATENTATMQARSIAHDLARLESLRTATQVVSRGRHPDTDLVTRAQRALVNAGLPLSACSGVQPRGVTVLAGTGVHVQTVQLTLHALRPGELGSWLAGWMQGDQPWLVSEVQLTHVAEAQGATPAGTSLDSNRFDVSLQLSAPYMEDSP